LHEDPAFREFFKLQQGFQWNVATRLVSCLERLLGKESNGTNDLLVIQTLDLIQGVLLLHPPSRGLFAYDIHMNVGIMSFIYRHTVLTALAFPRPTRSFQLPCNPILHASGPRHLTPRSSPQHKNFRVSRRLAGSDEPLQSPNHFPRSQAQACGISLLLSHARNSYSSNGNFNICV